MNELIVIQVGQCGNQIGSCLLPGILEEYDISTSNGTNRNRDKTELQECISSFFHYNSKKSHTVNDLTDLINAKAKIRFLCIDMEDSVVARVKSGKFRDLYDKNCLITNYPGSGNNWAEGFSYHGPKFQNKILKSLRYMIEKCENLIGFLLIFSMGGGTGSGLGTFVLKLLKDFYPKLNRFVVCVYPTGTEDVITGPYNMAFATEQLLNNATCVFPIENRSLLDMILQKTGRFSHKNGSVVPFGAMEDFNQIIVDMILHLTSGVRFSGNIKIDINDIRTNIVPFPRLNFLATGFSPIQLKHLNNNGTSVKNQLFLSCCGRNSQLVKVDPLDSRFVNLGIILLGRGCYTIHEINTYIEKLKRKLHLSNKGAHSRLCNVAPKNLEFSMFSICNTTAMSILFKKIQTQFVQLYQRKAYVHHYTGISEFSIENFSQCQSTISDIIEFYDDIPRMNF